ncbi:hypothetical protein AX17_002227 [Amanita inopinata Kibby_2008]|nr:hypothetical protein AX17_002227 [Amanita inopinata Kibby_2008]
MYPSFMKRSLLVLLLALTAVNASWWTSSDGGNGNGNGSGVDSYESWSTSQLKAWLEAHHIPLPTSTSPSQSDLRALVAENWDTASTWTYDQYTSAQQAFANVRDATFDKWDESRLRQFLLEQGIVAPSGPREHLVLLAKARYRDFARAAGSLSASASDTASTWVYGDTAHQASRSASSVVSSATSAVVQATKEVSRALEDSKDYVYSTWSDNQLRSYLEKKGLLKTREERTRDQLLTMMKDAYATTADPVYDAWSDSYMHEWLVSRHIVKSDYEKNRDALRAQLNRYYYGTRDYAWSTWSDSQLKQWLVDRGIIKSDAQVTRDKMKKMVEDNYFSARDTFWQAWSDNAIRDWLVERGYMRSDAQVKRDELIKMANDKYTDWSSKTAAYLAWPDARLRAYLRERGVSDEHLPGNRLGLLQETRIRWIQTQNKAEAAFAKIRDIVNEGVYMAEENLNRVFGVLVSHWDDTKERVTRGYDKAAHAAHEGAETVQHEYEGAKESAKDKYEHAKERAYSEYEERAKEAQAGKEWVGEKVSAAESGAHEGANKVRETVGETVKQAGQKMKGEL